MKKIVLIVVFLGFSLSALPQGLKLKVFKLKRSDGYQIYSVVNDLKSPDARVTYDAGSNQLIVMDHPGNLITIENLINELDVREKNVEIKVLVSETSTEFVNSIGAHRGALIIPQAKFQGVISAIKTDTDSRIRNQMTVRALSGHPANLQVSREEIFGYNVVSHYGSSGAVTVVSPHRQDIGSFLQALPTANNDGTITVAIQPSVSRSRDGVPQESAILTQVTLNDGDTVVLGGLDSEVSDTTSQTTTVFGIPLSKTTQKEKRKILMFLTATVDK
jgi:type II secretory pathway component GspD/PulD (secretin)